MLIAGKTWRELRVMALVYTAILELQLLLAVLLWPNLRHEAARSIADIMPADFLRRMMIQISDPDAGYRAYMATQMFFKGVNIVGLAAAVLFATGIVARERENGTLEFLLARPVSRSRILAEKFAVVVAAVLVPVFLTSWSAVPLSWLVEEELSLRNVTLGALHNALFCLVFLAWTCAFSVRARTQLHVAFVIGAIVLVQVGIFFIQEIRVVSIFRFSDFDVYGPIMAGNRTLLGLMAGQGVWMLLLAAVGYVVADRLFQRATP